MRVSWNYIFALVGGFVLSITFFVACLYTQLGIVTHQSEWIWSLNQKKERVAASISGPRLLVVAGSSILFGVNAQLIQQETGFPTVNMGTHAGVLLQYRLDKLRDIARPGDIILMAWEYEHYVDGYSYSAETTYDYILAHDPKYFRHMSLWDKIAMATRLPFKRIQKGWHNRHHPEVVRPYVKPYSAYTPISAAIDCTDDNGDEIFNFAETRPRRPPPGMQSDVLMDGDIDGTSSSFDELADFIAWAHQNHITVLATYPNMLWQPGYAKPASQKSLEVIRQFYVSHGVPFVGTVDTAMIYSLDDLFDGHYHPTHDGALKHTEKLIPPLRAYLPVTH